MRKSVTKISAIKNHIRNIDTFRLVTRQVPSRRPAAASVLCQDACQVLKVLDTQMSERLHLACRRDQHRDIKVPVDLRMKCM